MDPLDPQLTDIVRALIASECPGAKELFNLTTGAAVLLFGGLGFWIGRSSKQGHSHD